MTKAELSMDSTWKIAFWVEDNMMVKDSIAGHYIGRCPFGEENEIANAVLAEGSIYDDNDLGDTLKSFGDPSAQAEAVTRAITYITHAFAKYSSVCGPKPKNGKTWLRRAYDEWLQRPREDDAVLSLVDDSEEVAA